MDNIKRELILPVPIERAKEIIDAIGEHGKGSGFVMHNKNEVLKTYRFGLVSGMSASNCNVTLTKKEDETWAVFEMMGTNANNDNIQNRMLDRFLDVIGKGVSGEVVNADLLKKHDGGCFGILFFLIAGCLWLFSCSRDNTTTQQQNQTSGDYYVRLKANGQAIEHKGNILQNLTSGVHGSRAIINLGSTSQRQLSVIGQTGANNAVILSIVKDSVRSGDVLTIDNPATNGMAGVTIEGKQYGTFSNNNVPQYSLQVRIISHSGGWIEGTFFGKLGRMTSTGSPLTFEDVNVTDGAFKTKVVY